MSYQISTAGIDPADQFDFWRSAVSRAFVPLEARTTDPSGFRGRLRGDHLGEIGLYQATADPHTVHRSRRMIALADAEHYKIGLQLFGTAVLAQDGREVALAPGDFAVYDTSRPYTLSFSGVASTLVLVFPRAMVRVAPAVVERLTATRFSGGAGISGLVSAFLVQLARNLGDPRVLGSARLAHNVVDLLGTALAERADLPDPPTEPARHAMLLRIKSYIEARLNDPQLTPAEIAAAHHISTRYLHKLFSDTGRTVSGWTRQRRLERCGQDLADPRNQRLPIGVIGARWGLTDASYLSRAFKTEFGVSPSEYRSRNTRS